MWLGGFVVLFVKRLVEDEWSVALSPRGDLRMPSDACATLWLEELDQF